MAEDVASRVAGAEALPSELRERLERAAARFGSIHQRWATSELTAGDAVSVTPILGIDTDESDEAGRPRFKTLMGVPRSSPDLDELAGLDGSAERHDTVPIERSALQPPAAAASTARASQRVDEAPSLAGTSLPCGPGEAPALSRVFSPAPWPSLGQRSLQVSAEVAALRTGSRRRPWWIGLGTIAAAAALFAIAAPRQRALGLHWLESEYRARQRPTGAAISDTAQALRPGSSAASSPPSPLDRATAQLEPPVPVPPRAPEEAPAEQAAEPPGARAAGAAAAGSAEDSSEGAAGAKLSDEDLAGDARALGNTSRELNGSSDGAAAPASAGAESRPTKGKRAARDARSGGATTKARAHVAAPRKPSQRDDNRQSSSATKVAASPGSSATKGRATRQNTPRKDGGSGIIRETPF